jgi:hypothetical protein
MMTVYYDNGVGSGPYRASASHIERKTSGGIRTYSSCQVNAAFAFPCNFKYNEKMPGANEKEERTDPISFSAFIQQLVILVVLVSLPRSFENLWQTTPAQIISPTPCACMPRAEK